jgi:hypothetical protein
MARTTAAARPGFTQPVRQILTVLVILGAVAAGVWLIRDVVRQLLDANPWLNGAIALVFVLGVVNSFWQLGSLVASVGWIDGFTSREAGYGAGNAPRLLAPLAALLEGRAERLQISTTAQRSILDSVATRLDEGRDVTRYLGNLLIFLGLLGTFYGLATSVPAMVETIRNLAPAEGETGVAVFAKLMAGLEAQLGAMGTAFSSSLLGLAGSLVVGLIDLFAGHGQNRFYRELEEWLSTITRVGYAGSDAEGSGEAGPVVAALEGIAERIEAQFDGLQALYAQAEGARDALDGRLGQLAAATERLAAAAAGDHTGAALAASAAAQAAAADRVAALLTRLAALQEGALAETRSAAQATAQGLDRLAALLAPEEGGPHVDAEARMRLRSIDVQLLRILEELSAGRQETTADLRADISALTAAVRQLSRVNTAVKG